MTGKSRPSSSPRLYCLMAREAPVALVFRRGPGAWSHLLRWHYDEGVLEPGVWLRKRLFPEKCDLSDDGELMLYNLSGAWKGEYTVYGGISRAPWLHPLVDWDLRSTYSCGRAFVKGEPDSHSWGEPESIELGGRDVIVQTNGGGSSVNELRRGWELRDQPKTEERVRVYAAVLRKPSPAGGFTLQQRVSYRYAREIQIQRGSGEFVAIEDAAWADWDRRGRLLIASRSGELRIEEVDAGGARLVVQRHDLSTLKPTVPAPAPEWARSATAAREKIDETRLKLMARISCLLAIGAPVALVFWRGAGGWGHLMRWRYLEGVVEPGAWSRMVLWASVCDLSMDGELLLFPTRPGSARRLFASISRAPWLHPLVTWQARGIADGAASFVEGAELDADSAGERLRFDIGGRSVTVRQGGTGNFVGRRGWEIEKDASAVSPAETRTVLWKRSPDGRFVLRRIGVEGAALSGSAGEVEFRIDAGGVCEIDMTNVAWADWGQGGCLLVATRDGRLRVEKISAAGRVLVNEHDVRDLEPAAGGAPAWAQRG